MEFLDLDFRLVEASCELYALEDHLELIAGHLSRIREAEEAQLKKCRDSLSPDDPERDWWYQDYWRRNEVDYPRLFLGPFLISLYATYESAVIEIAQLIRNKRGVEIDINDLRGRGFLNYARAYYSKHLDFVLCRNNCDWEQIKILSTLRNAYAHANGRTSRLKNNVVSDLKRWSAKEKGIVVGVDYVNVEIEFARRALRCVQSALRDLIERFKSWDDNMRSI